MQSEQINELAAAMAKAQGAMKNATINKVNPHYKSKYADLAAVFDAVRKPLADQGLIVTQTTEIRDGGFVLVTMLAHSSGQWIRSDYPLPQAGRPQELGSALTYARRYSLSAITGIAADEDDDAEGAEQQRQKVETIKIAPRPAPPIEPPHDPQTGEIAPHAIKFGDGDSFVSWGGRYIAALKSAQQATDIAEWEAKNKQTLADMEHNAPKAYRSVVAARNSWLAELSQTTEAAE